jgi:hypothetical protein
MSRLAWASLALVFLVSGTARADLVFPTRPPPPSGPSLQLVLVSGSGARGVPAEDVSRVEAAVQSHLASQRRRVDLCLRNADLREDPMRSRVRRIELRVRVDRTGRGRASVQRNDGMPAAVRSCVLESLSGVNVRPGPRGEVTVRVVYELR